jgi:hypothetical protein
MDLIMLIGATVLLYSTSIGVTGWRLGRLTSLESRWRLFIPGLNLILLYSVAGRSGFEAAITIASFVVLPLLGAVLLIPLGARLMARTGRAWVWGAVLTIPPFGLIGLPIIALTAEHFDD